MKIQELIAAPWELASRRLTHSFVSQWWNLQLLQRRTQQPKRHRYWPKNRKFLALLWRLLQRPPQSMMLWLTSKPDSLDVIKTCVATARNNEQSNMSIENINAFYIVRWLTHPHALNDFRWKFPGSLQTRSAALKKALAGHVKVTMNAEPPRKACFEVKVNGKAVLSLLDMPRPFQEVGFKLSPPNSPN